MIIRVYVLFSWVLLTSKLLIMSGSSWKCGMMSSHPSNTIIKAPLSQDSSRHFGLISKVM